MSEREAVTIEDLDGVNRRVDALETRFAEAFPGGDHVGHCRYHALMIEDIDTKKRLRQAVLEKSIAGLVWAGMIALGLAVWQYIKTELGK